MIDSCHVSTVDVVLHMIDGTEIKHNCKNMDEVIMFLARVERDTEDE